MPLSSAARTHASTCSSSTWLPWVSQLPYEISLTRRPLRPRCRCSMNPTLCPGEEASDARCGLPRRRGLAALDLRWRPAQPARLHGPDRRVAGDAERLLVAVRR